MDGNLVLLIAGAALILAAVIAAIVVVLKYMRTGAKKYSVDYCGGKEMFKDAKDKYRAGEKVRLYYDAVATDTDYAFFVDGKEINVGFEHEKGYIIAFDMPEHNIKVEYTAHNSMEEKTD